MKVGQKLLCSWLTLPLLNMLPPSDLSSKTYVDNTACFSYLCLISLQSTAEEGMGFFFPLPVWTGPSFLWCVSPKYNGRCALAFLWGCKSWQCIGKQTQLTIIGEPKYGNTSNEYLINVDFFTLFITVNVDLYYIPDSPGPSNLSHTERLGPF